jgi:hypothetical protein
LIWALAYHKAHNPEKFWKACLKHCEGSYSKWVYWQEAKLAGAVPAPLEGGECAELARTGRWSSGNFIPACTEIRRPGEVEFLGLVANYRVFKSGPKDYITFATLGTGNGRYLDVMLPHAISFSDQPILWGKGRLDYTNSSECVKVYKSKKLHLKDIEHIT